MTAVVGVEGYHISYTNEATTWRQARSWRNGVAGRRDGGKWAVGYPGIECYINVYSLVSAESRNVASS
jgi:hypothetical protein